MQKLEMIFPFDENEYTNEGIHIESDQFILDQQETWEAEFYSKYSNQAKKKINFVEYENQADRKMILPSKLTSLDSCSPTGNHH